MVPNYWLTYTDGQLLSRFLDSSVTFLSGYTSQINLRFPTCKSGALPVSDSKSKSKGKSLLALVFKLQSNDFNSVKVFRLVKSSEYKRPTSSATHWDWDIKLVLAEEIRKIGFVTRLVVGTSPTGCIEVVNVEANSIEDSIRFSYLGGRNGTNGEKKDSRVIHMMSVDVCKEGDA